jgi:hypothetical protein
MPASNIRRFLADVAALQPCENNTPTNDETVSHARHGVTVSTTAERGRTFFTIVLFLLLLLDYRQ